MLEGAEEHGLPPSYIEELKRLLKSGSGNFAGLNH
jgi:hypothetical protein